MAEKTEEQQWISPSPTPEGRALDRLSARQRRFVEHYIAYRNGTEAYMQSGYHAIRSTAGRAAHVLLKHPDIKQAIVEAEAEVIERVRLRQDEAYSQLRAVATSDVTHYQVDDDGNLIIDEAATPFASKAVSSINRRVTTRKTRDGEEIKTTDVKLTLWNKLEAVKIVGQMDGWIKPEKPDNDGPQNNYFLNLIQVLQQNHGISSEVGADAFLPQPIVAESEPTKSR